MGELAVVWPGSFAEVVVCPVRPFCRLCNSVVGRSSRGPSWGLYHTHLLLATPDRLVVTSDTWGTIASCAPIAGSAFNKWDGVDCSTPHGGSVAWASTEC